MEIVKTATRGATITQNIHNKPDVGMAINFRFQLATPPYISMRSDMLLDTFLAVLLVM